MSDDVDAVAEMEQREAERFAAALRAQRERPLPTMNTCVTCGEILEPHRRQFGRCFLCAARAESRRG